MKKTILILAAPLLFFCFASCDDNNGYVPATSMELRTAAPSTVENSYLQYERPTVTATFPLSTLSTDGENIFVGTDQGQYLVFNFENKKWYSFTLPGNCRILNSQGAICELDSNLYIANTEMGTKKKLPIPSVHTWSLTANQGAVYFTTQKSDNVYNLYLYYVQNDKLVYLTQIDDREWLGFPQISPDSRHLIGRQFFESRINLIEIDIQNNRYLQVGSEIIGDATDFAWSPVASLGVVGSTDGSYGDYFCSSTIISIYDATSGEIKQFFHAPENVCYYYFTLYARDIWSPNGNELVLMTNNESICVINIGDNSQRCSEIVESGEYIDKIAWSPDSKHLVVVVKSESDWQMRIYLAEDLSVISSESFTLSPLGVDDLIWCNP